MNRSVNDGVKLNRQKEMLPIMMMESKKDDKGERGFVDNRTPSLFPDTSAQYDEWSTFLADEVDCDPSEILSYEMTLYPTGKAVYLV